MDGDEIAIITWDDEYERKRIYEIMSPSRSIVNTANIKYNNDIGPNNNTAVLLYKGYSKPAKLIKL